VPLGVRMLAGGAVQKVAAFARVDAAVHGTILAGALALGWAMRTVPGFVRPVLRHTLEWAALRPVAAFAAICLLQALLLARSSALMVDKQGKLDK